jgi:hypothetical protein
MVLIPLEIKKEWTEGSTIVEADWDNIRTPLLSFSVNTNNNFAQLGKDVFGSTYQWDNDGNPNRTTSLVDSLLFADQNYTITGEWTFTTIPDLGTVTTADINGGTVDGTVIGGGTPAAATFTDLAATTFDINGGTIDGTTIGGATPAAGTFTALTVPAITRYYSVSTAAFVCSTGVQEDDRNSTLGDLNNVNGSFASREFVAAVNLPNGATVTSLKSYFYRDDAASTIVCSLERYAGDATNVQMALCTSASTAGDHNVEDTTITSGTINNSAYSYNLVVTIDNNNAITDAKFYMAVITYTVTTPLI